MTEYNREEAKKNYFRVVIPTSTDPRGQLCHAEWKDLPFAPQRVFWITDIPEGKTRGDHAHETNEEVVFCIKGSVDIIVEDECTRETFHLDKASEGIYIGKNVWCMLQNFSSDAVCMVLASQPYSAIGYCKNYEEWKSGDTKNP